MPDFSNNFKINVNSHMALESPIVLLEITHPQLSQTIRLVQDNCDVVSNGNTYIAMSFNFKRQPDVQGELPKVTLTVQNIGRSLVKWIDQSGGGRDAQVIAKIIRRSDPDVIEESVTLGVERVSINMFSVIFSLVVYNNLAKRGIKISYTPKRFPGLF